MWVVCGPDLSEPRDGTSSGRQHGGTGQVRRERPHAAVPLLARQRPVEGRAVPGGALARVRAGRPGRAQEGPVAGLEREQLAQGAVARGGAARPRPAAPPRARRARGRRPAGPTTSRASAASPTSSRARRRAAGPPGSPRRRRRRATARPVPRARPRPGPRPATPGPRTTSARAAPCRARRRSRPPPRTRAATRATKSAASRGDLPARAVRVVGRAVVGPGAMVVLREGVVVAVGRVRGVAAVAPDELDHGAVQRHEQRPGRRAPGPQVPWVGRAEDVGEVDAGGVDAGLLEQRVQPRRVGALGQPEASAPRRRRRAPGAPRSRSGAAAGPRRGRAAAAARRASAALVHDARAMSAPARSPPSASRRSAARA